MEVNISFCLTIRRDNKRTKMKYTLEIWPVVNILKMISNGANIINKRVEMNIVTGYPFCTSLICKSFLLEILHVVKLFQF